MNVLAREPFANLPRGHQAVYSIHRWVRIAVAEEYLRLGWVPQATLDGTSHGLWSVHMVWICPECQPIEPKRATA